MNNTLLLPAAFVFSFLACCLIIWLSKGRHWLDIPNDRSSHETPTPTAGGMAFVTVFCIAALLVFRVEDPGFNYSLVLLLGFSIAVLGLMDDIFQLGIGPRLSTQAVAVFGVLAIFGSPVLPFFGLGLDLGFIGYLLIFAAMLWFINLFNFMDGLDGIATMETLFILLSVIWLTFSDDSEALRNLSLLLVACLSGFLLVNFPPARLFMGDCGSNFLGFILGVAALISTTSGLTNIWVWSILAGVFIVDSTYTLIKRMSDGETWYYAHRNHAYQIAARRLNSHLQVVMLASAINIFWLLPLAWICHRYPDWGLVLVMIAWLPLLLLTMKVRASQLHDLKETKNIGKNMGA
jgi:Fuc2NAc and GlcNAc transferase